MSFRASTHLALAATFLVLVACGSDESGSGPEAPWCTVGTVAPGDSVKGAISTSSCRTFDATIPESAYTAAWTLHAQADSAYIVRLRHVPDGNGHDSLKASLLAYTPDSSGQPLFATGFWYGFGTQNDNGMANQEMFLATHIAQPLSIRVNIPNAASAGDYTLSVEACRVRPFNGDGTYGAVDVTTGCRSESYLNDGHPYRLVFFSYPADTLGDYTVTGTRIGGTGTITPTADGPDLDLDCWTAGCFWFHPSVNVTSFSYAPHVTKAQRVTLFIGVRAESTATVDVSGITPGSAGAPRFSATPAALLFGRDHGPRR